MCTRAQAERARQSAAAEEAAQLQRNGTSAALDVDGDAFAAEMVGNARARARKHAAEHNGSHGDQPAQDGSDDTGSPDEELQPAKRAKVHTPCKLCYGPHPAGNCTSAVRKSIYRESLGHCPSM